MILNYNCAITVCSFVTVSLIFTKVVEASMLTKWYKMKKEILTVNNAVLITPVDGAAGIVSIETTLGSPIVTGQL